MRETTTDHHSISRLILFVHIPKTAGTSFRRAMEQLFHGEMLFDYPQKRSPEVAEHVHAHPDRGALLRVIQRQSIAILCGHAPYRRYQDLVPPERVVVLFREPVQRVVSEYHHHVRHGRYEGPLLDFAAQRRERDKQWKMVQGLDLARAGVVGLTERYGEALSLFARRFGVELPQLQENRNPAKTLRAPYDITDRERERLRELNAKDVEICGRVNRLLESRE